MTTPIHQRTMRLPMTLLSRDFPKTLAAAAMCLVFGSAWARPDNCRSIYVSERSDLIIDWRNGKAAVIPKGMNHVAVLNALMEANVFSTRSGSRCEEIIDGMSFVRPQAGTLPKMRGVPKPSNGREIWVNRTVSASPVVTIRYLYSPGRGVTEFSIFRGRTAPDATYRLKSGYAILGSCN